jgi:hypothetical protein
MTSRRHVPLTLFLAGVLHACADEPDRRSGAGPARGDSAAAVAVAVTDTAPAPEAVERARTAADALGKELQSRLLAALDSGGPSRALAYCADSAQAVTARHARAGVYVRRVSLRVRNPANRPDAAEERQLRHLDSLHRAGTFPAELVRSRRVASGERVVEYARPILVQPGCLACHGDREHLAPGVREVLAARYPEDEATGYRAGDLRGMIAVRVRR